MKQLLFSIILFLLNITVFSVAHSNDVRRNLHTIFRHHQNTTDVTWYLIIWQKDGSAVVFNLTEKPKITYVGDKVIVKSSTTLGFDFQSIKKMTYTQDITESINDLTIEKDKPFTINGKTISFFPAEENLHVRVVLINGMVVNDFIVRKEEPYTFSLDSFMQNMFILTVNGVSYKIKIR